MRQHGLLPDRITYNALFCAWGVLQLRALGFVQAMRHQGLLPNAITYDVLVAPARRSEADDNLAALRDKAATAAPGPLTRRENLQRLDPCLREDCATAESL